MDHILILMYMILFILAKFSQSEPLQNVLNLFTHMKHIVILLQMYLRSESYVIHLARLNMDCKNTIMHLNNHVITHIIQIVMIQSQRKNLVKLTFFPKLLCLIWITM